MLKKKRLERRTCLQHACMSWWCIFWEGQLDTKPSCTAIGANTEPAPLPFGLFIPRQISLAKSKHEPHHQIIFQIAVEVTGPPVLSPQPPAANQLLHLFRVTSLKRRSNGFVTGGLLCCSTCYTTAHHLLSSAWVDIHGWKRDVHFCEVWLYKVTQRWMPSCHRTIQDT